MSSAALTPPPAPVNHNRRSVRRLLRILPVAAVLIALLISLLLVSGVQQDVTGAGSSVLEDSYFWVLLLTALALLVLLWAIGYRLLTLIRRVRSGEPGALLAARWVRNFLVLSLPPALVVYFFSAWFLTSTIDSWFDVEVERALADSLALGQQFLGIRTLEVRNQLLETAADLQDLSEEGDLLRQALLARVRASGPLELSILEEDGTLVAVANINTLTGLPERAGDFALLQAAQRGEYAAAEPAANGELHIRVLVSMPAQYPGESARLLQAIYPLPTDITALTSSIEQEYHRYQNVSYLRESLKQSFLLILSLVLLLTVLLAILAALTAARRMVAPLSRLSSATEQVAAGDFGRDVEAGERDEIGFLVNSFNQMTQALKQASLSAEHSRAQLQAQGDYLETVLGNLSSGVLTLDAQENIIRANRACREFLELPAGLAPETAAGTSLHSLEIQAPYLEPLFTAIRQQSQRGRAVWQQEISLQRGNSRLVLLARGSLLQPVNPDGLSQQQGQVIIFDDVTVLNQAQREAAWAEVAKRLAHEVKNPLTPIRLAAERLRMKLAGKLDAADQDMLDRSSNTIVAQVEALRTLVDAFGDYAREPVLARSTIQLDELIREVVTLYQQGDAASSFALQLCAGPGGLQADSGRLRQMLHNLIRNAMEATAPAAAEISISDHVITLGSRDWMQLEIRDEGPGFPAVVLERPFEPYVTHKAGGSGLGLAICRKIVTEHDGRIALSNPADGGALVTILLPLEQHSSKLFRG
jgi:nitrogen fixation/metabolism regulation signal transduction histidine kinase